MNLIQVLAMAVLGRLASCLLDSLATQQYPAVAMGFAINMEFSIRRSGTECK